MLIYTGNLFLDDRGTPVAPVQRLGGHRVAVPTHCYKIVLFDHPGGRVEIFAFLFRNHFEVEERPLSAYQVSVDELERLSGVDFFPQRPDWAALEAAVEPWVDVD